MAIFGNRFGQQYHVPIGRTSFIQLPILPDGGRSRSPYRRSSSSGKKSKDDFEIDIKPGTTGHMAFTTGAHKYIMDMETAAKATAVNELQKLSDDDVEGYNKVATQYAQDLSNIKKANIDLQARYLQQEQEQTQFYKEHTALKGQFAEPAIFGDRTVQARIQKPDGTVEVRQISYDNPQLDPGESILEVFNVQPWNKFQYENVGGKLTKDNMSRFFATGEMPPLQSFNMPTFIDKDKAQQEYEQIFTDAAGKTIEEIVGTADQVKTWYTGKDSSEVGIANYLKKGNRDNLIEAVKNFESMMSPNLQNSLYSEYVQDTKALKLNPELANEPAKTKNGKIIYKRNNDGTIVTDEEGNKVPLTYGEANSWEAWLMNKAKAKAGTLETIDYTTAKFRKDSGASNLGEAFREGQDLTFGQAAAMNHIYLRSSKNFTATDMWNMVKDTDLGSNIQFGDLEKQWKQDYLTANEMQNIDENDPDYRNYIAQRKSAEFKRQYNEAEDKDKFFKNMYSKMFENKKATDYAIDKYVARNPKAKALMGLGYLTDEDYKSVLKKIIKLGMVEQYGLDIDSYMTKASNQNTTIMKYLDDKNVKEGFDIAYYNYTEPDKEGDPYNGMNLSGREITTLGNTMNKLEFDPNKEEYAIMVDPQKVVHGINAYSDMNLGVDGLAIVSEKAMRKIQANKYSSGGEWTAKSLYDLKEMAGALRLDELEGTPIFEEYMRKLGLANRAALVKASQNPKDFYLVNLGVKGNELERGYDFPAREVANENKRTAMLKKQIASRFINVGQ